LGIMNLAQAAARMAAAAIDIEAAKRAALEEACQIVKARAQNLIGHPQPSWPPLAPETIEHKDGVNSPLLDTGLLRSSLAYTVIDSNHAEMGSDLDRAIFMELGTSRGTPPRPFLSLAAMQSGPDIEKVVAKTVGSAVAGGLAGSRVRDFFEIAHIAGEVLHSIHETASDFIDSDEEERKR
jgi:hypothetical protein